MRMAPIGLPRKLMNILVKNLNHTIFKGFSMFKTVTSTLLACAATALLGSFAMAYAADAPPPPAKPAAPMKMEHMAPTKEMREQMASLHEKMAACLRSAKSIDDCHHEMMAAHEKMEGAMGEKHEHEHDCEHMMKMHEPMDHAKGAEHEHDKDATK